MALRMVEISVPGDYKGDVRWTEEHPFISIWEEELVGGRRLVRGLLNTEDTEALLHALEREVDLANDYRIVILPVEATVPRPDEVDEEPSGEQKTPRTRVSTEELYADITESLRISPVYYTLVALSTIVAAGGMLRDEVAVVVGAMVIAPLIGPSIALALGTTLGDMALVWRAFQTNLKGMGTALVLSVAIGVVLEISPEVPQIANRSAVDLGNVALALAAGVAGALSYTRGMSAALIGVMVAVALLPPLVAFGMLAGAGQWGAAYGAALLLLVNVSSVNLAAVLTFVVQGVRPGQWYEAVKAKRATRFAIGLSTAILVTLVLAILLSPWEGLS